jgi:glycosyltransferase involved in cell wall biosynthesis
MAEPTLSIIVPTRGRKTLERTLRSISGQLQPGDEVIVLRDETGDSGDSARMSGMERARGSHLAFMDDDDVYRPGALEKMRRFARDNPGRIGIFKMQHPVGTTHWRDGEPVLRYANVSTQNFLIPNLTGRLGRWTDRPPRPGGGVYDGDYAFIARTVELQGEPLFVDEVTVLARPVRNPVWLAWIRLRYRMRLRSRLDR